MKPSILKKSIETHPGQQTTESITSKISTSVDNQDTKSNFARHLQARRALSKLFGNEVYETAEERDAKLEYIFDVFPSVDSIINSKEGLYGKEALNRNFRTVVLDAGLGSGSSFYFHSNQEPEYAPPVPMLNRAAFTSKIFQKIGLNNGKYNPNKPVVFLGLDITRLSNADKYEDDKGNKYADIILNKFAATIQNLSFELQEKYNQESEEDVDPFSTYQASTSTAKKEEIEIIVDRHGGDEFTVAVLGTNDESIISDIKKQIKDRVGQIKGWYQYETSQTIVGENGEEEVITKNILKNEPVALKDDKIDDIRIPQNESEQQIFMAFFRRGLLCDQQQLDYTINIFRDKNGEINNEKLSDYLESIKRKSIYPDYVHKKYGKELEHRASYHAEVRAKADYLFKVDNKIGAMVYSAITHDKKTGGYTSMEILQYVENILYDPLLNEYMKPFSYMFNEIINDEYSKVYFFDVGVKEFNENLGYAIADQVIVEMWECIKKSIHEDDWHKVSFARTGPKIYLAVKKGETVSEETNRKLKSIKFLNALKSEQNPNGIRVPIGESRIALDMKIYDQFYDNPEDIYKIASQKRTKTGENRDEGLAALVEKIVKMKNAGLTPDKMKEDKDLVADFEKYVITPSLKKELDETYDRNKLTWNVRQIRIIQELTNDGNKSELYRQDYTPMSTSKVIFEYYSGKRAASRMKDLEEALLFLEKRPNLAKSRNINLNIVRDNFNTIKSTVESLYNEHMEFINKISGFSESIFSAQRYEDLDNSILDLEPFKQLGGNKIYITNYLNYSEKILQIGYTGRENNEIRNYSMEMITRLKNLIKKPD